MSSSSSVYSCLFFRINRMTYFLLNPQVAQNSSRIKVLSDLLARKYLFLISCRYSCFAELLIGKPHLFRLPILWRNDLFYVSFRLLYFWRNAFKVITRRLSCLFNKIVLSL